MVLDCLALDQLLARSYRVIIWPCQDCLLEYTIKHVSVAVRGEKKNNNKKQQFFIYFLLHDRKPSISYLFLYKGSKMKTTITILAL